MPCTPQDADRTVTPSLAEQFVTEFELQARSGEAFDAAAPSDATKAALVVARELDVREFRARTTIEVALQVLEERAQLVEPTALEFRQHAAKVRGAVRNASEAFVELASIAGEYDGLARGL